MSTIRRGDKVRTVIGHRTVLDNVIEAGAEGTVSKSIAPYQSEDGRSMMVWVQFNPRSGAWLPTDILEPVE